MYGIGKPGPCHQTTAFRATTTTPPIPKVDNLELWYDAGNTAPSPDVTDLSGNGRTGTRTGSRGFVASAGTTFNNASFSFTDGYLDTNAVIALNAFTVSAWFRSTGNATTQRALIANEEEAGGDWNYRILLDSTTGYLLADVNDTSTTLALNNTTNMHDSEWHHASFVRTGNLQFAGLYLDSVLVDSEASDPTAADITNAQEVWIGKSAYNVVGGYPWIGNIAQVTIHNVALSADEVKDLYDANKRRYKTDSADW